MKDTRLAHSENKTMAEGPTSAQYSIFVLH